MGRFTAASVSRSLLRGLPFWLKGVIVGAMVAGPLAAQEQELNWRYNYNEARQEAQNKNRPLILDFGTTHCFWCNKLESTTFRDPVVLGLMNERFIPLKVDAEANPQLTEALHIQSFPTLVLAGPDGKILGTLEGYMDAPKLHGHLQHALATVSNPEWMTRDYEAAAKAVAASDFARAVALLKGILEDHQERPIQVKSADLLKNVEQQADSRLAQAKQMQDKGQNTDALAALTELVRSFPGTQAAGEGGKLLSSLALKPDAKEEQRTQKARELLVLARQDFHSQQYLCCMDRCESIAADYPDLPEGSEAIQMLAEIKSNPEWIRQACDTLSDRLGGLYLCQADTWLKKGQPQQAVLCLERVMQAFPSSHQAEVAQERLSQIQGQPTQRADFKKP